LPFAGSLHRSILAGAGRLAAPGLLAVLLSAGSAHAVGTPAGTDIVNQATATYDVGAQTFTQSSNVTTTRVAELLSVSVVWQDAANVQVGSGDTHQLLTFRVTNTGNGGDTFQLAPRSTIPGDDFDPVFNTLYLDTNGNGTYDAGTDPAYVQGLNDPPLAADGFLTVFLASDIPSGRSDGDLGDSELTATSRTGSGAPGSVVSGAGESGTDAVVGTTGGESTATGTYAVSAVAVVLVKSVSVSDPFGGAQPVPGAVLTYTIVADGNGNGVAAGVVITDSMPVFTTYVPGSLTLNSLTLTDAADADAGDHDATAPGAITVALGDLGAGAGPQTITFQTTID
jgi:uncharacterized repeat protein (TIGR01451 family)